jgi:ADP-heptose:LPS heptosyltransferase
MRLATKQRLDYVLGGAGIFVLRPLTVVLGHLLGRDHSLTVKDRVAFIKMLGGGSLVLALPALLGFRRKYPDARLLLVTTNAVKAFAEAIAVFDEVIVVDDRSLAGLLKTGTRAMRKLFRVDTVIDLEVYSRLSTVLATMSCARNRVGFYLENTYWREHMATHLVFFNRFAGSFHFYEAVVRAFGADPPDLADCGRHIARANGIEVCASSSGSRVTAQSAPGRVCIAPACSELGHERMLDESQWARVLPRVASGAEEVVVLGGPADGRVADALIAQGRRVLPEVKWVNACDGRTLRDSLHVLAGCSRLVAIDSSILHFGRLFGIPTLSFWGPTDPMTRLKDVSVAGDSVWYEKVLCSPCVHVAETPPCSGRNLCIEAAVRRCCGEEVESIAEASYVLPFTHIKRKSRGEPC